MKVTKWQDILDSASLEAKRIGYIATAVTGVVMVVTSIAKAVEIGNVINLKSSDPDAYYNKKYDKIFSDINSSKNK